MFGSRPYGSPAARDRIAALRALVDADSVLKLGVDEACAAVDDITGRRRTDTELATTAKNILRYGGVLGGETARHDLFDVLLPAIVAELQTGEGSRLLERDALSSMHTYELMMKEANNHDVRLKTAREAAERLATVKAWSQGMTFAHSYPGGVSKALEDVALLNHTGVNRVVLATTRDRLSLIVHHVYLATGPFRSDLLGYFVSIAELAAAGNTRALLDYLRDHNSTWITFRQLVSPPGPPRS